MARFPSLRGLSLPASVLLASIATQAMAQDAPADLILFNGNIITMDDSAPTATAIAIGADRILMVGDGANALVLAGPQTALIDLGGRTVIPGFVDAHTHLFNDAWAWDEDLAGMQALALRNGITTFANMYTTQEFLAEMEAFAASGALRVRTSLYLSRTTNCGEDLGDWYRDFTLVVDVEAVLRIPGVKLFADGGTCGRPALTFPYEDTGEYGALFFNQEFLDAAVADAAALGFQVAIHAQGDAAIDHALNAIAALPANEGNRARHRIEHNAIIRDDQLPRYGELAIVPTIFGTYFTCYGIRDENYERIFGADALPILENWRRLVDANPSLVVAWHGDDPGVLPVSPILEMFGLVTRSQIDEETGEVCAAPDWLRAFGVSPEEALRMMTINAAYALSMDSAVGSLSVGKFADMVILSDSPLTIDPDAIPQIEIVATLLAGRVEFCGDAGESFCAVLGRASGQQ